MTRTRDGTPDRLVPERCKFAQSRGECPGESKTFPREFGVLTADVVESCGDNPPPGDRLGSGPRFGRGPVGVALNEFEDVGNARRFDTLSDGGGMRDDTTGLDGGAMDLGAEGGAMGIATRGGDTISG